MTETMQYQLGTDVPRKQRIVTVVVTAVVVAIAFQAILMARGNYDVWRFEVVAIELPVAIVAAFLTLPADKLDAWGAEWAAQYAPSRTGALYRVLSVLPTVAVRAAIMTACLSIPNALIIPPVVYREEVAFAPVAVLVQFLADIPQGIALCLAVRLFVERWFARQRKSEVAP